MTRQYIRRTTSTYSVKDLELAIAAIAEKTMTVQQAASHFKISRHTLYARISGRRGSGMRGGQTLLNHEEEELLVMTIEIYQRWQQPLACDDIISLAKDYLVQLGRPTERNLKEWFRSFMNRWHDQLKIVQSQKLENIRSISCTQKVVGESMH
jgi:hypothetical protein